MTRSRSILLAAIAAAALAVAPARADEAPAARSFHVGSLELVALKDAVFAAPNDGKIFGADVGPAAVAGALAKAGAPTDRITVGVDALLVKLPGHVVLLDTGLGPQAHGVLIASLALAGVQPRDVTDVLITHSHGDHIGGLATADGQPAFPKAVIRMSAKEWAYLQSQAGAKALVDAIAPQVQTFTPGRPILPGVTPIAIDGHTPGHVGYEIVSGEDRLLDIGDTAHSSIISLAQPDWTMGFDSDTALGKANRRATLTRLARSHEVIFAPHFPFPGVGMIEARDGAFAWRPTLTPGD